MLEASKYIRFPGISYSVSHKRDALPVVSTLFFLFLTLGNLLFCGTRAYAETEPVNLEYKIKIAYIYNFTKFIDWPESVFTTEQKTSFNVCVLGHNPFGHTLDLLNNKQVNGLELVTEISVSANTLDHCQIVYFPKEMGNNISTILAQISHKHILTVSDINNFAEKGGHIGLATVNGKVRFDINLGATRASGLKVSAKLLELALSVIE